jgi:hypothetical protein
MHWCFTASATMWVFSSAFSLSSASAPLPSPRRGTRESCSEPGNGDDPAGASSPRSGRLRFEPAVAACLRSRAGLARLQAGRCRLERRRRRHLVHPPLDQLRRNDRPCSRSHRIERLQAELRRRTPHPGDDDDRLRRSCPVQRTPRVRALSRRAFEQRVGGCGRRRPRPDALLRLRRLHAVVAVPHTRRSRCERNGPSSLLHGGRSSEGSSHR